MSLLKTLVECCSTDLERESRCGIYIGGTVESPVYCSTDGHFLCSISGTDSIEKLHDEILTECGLEIVKDYTIGDILMLAPIRKKLSNKKIIRKDLVYPQVSHVIPSSFSCPEVRPFFGSSVITRLAKIDKWITGKKEFYFPELWGDERGATITPYCGGGVIVLAMPIPVRSELQIRKNIDNEESISLSIPFIT